jgi:tetratricopeptide (TPR) repeat protein
MQDFEEAKQLFFRGLEFQQMKSPAEAECLYVRSLEFLPDRPSTLLNLSLVQFELGKIQEAKKAAERIILIDPKNTAALTLIGAIYLKLGLYDLAVSKLENVIALYPDHHEAYNVCGNALKELKRFDDALVYFRRAIELNPGQAEAYSNSGNVLSELERFGEALPYYDKAIALNPEYAEAYYNRGNVLRELNQFGEALANYDKATALNPGHVEAHYNRGNVLFAVGRHDEALACYDKAIAIKPDYADGRWGRSLRLLQIGDYDNGFREYEWRKRKGKPTGARSYENPLWIGNEDIAGKTILIHHEQGLGDTIQFCRYIRELEKIGANVLFAPQKSLQRLLSGIGNRCVIVDVDDESLDFAFHSPLLSLPLAFNTTVNTIPNRVPYLNAEPERVKHWRSRLGSRGFKIGICWQGSKNEVDKGRSFSVNEFYGLSLIKGVRLISLHKGAGEAQLESLPSGMVVEKPGADFDIGEQAFLDTAAIMNCCDLVITSDTAIAHLGGALAVPTWVALKYVPDWRWLLNRDDCPWYPTVRLFRQKQQDDWRSVFEEIADSLPEGISALATNS